MSDDSKRVILAMRGGATAEELDALLLEIKLQRSIRKRAEELSNASMNPRNLAVLNDLMRAAIELTH